MCLLWWIFSGETSGSLFGFRRRQVFFTSNPAGGWKSRAAMKVARGDKAVAVLNDKLHVVGGETKNSDGHSTPLMDVEVGVERMKDMKDTLREKTPWESMDFCDLKI